MALLRSSSSPVLNARGKDVGLMEPELVHKRRSVLSLTMPSYGFGRVFSRTVISRARSEADLRDLASKRIAGISPPWSTSSSISEETSMAAAGYDDHQYIFESMQSAMRRVLSSSGLASNADEDSLTCSSDDGLGCGGDDGIRDGGSGGDDQGSESDGTSGEESLDLYYQRIIQAYPGNSLFLSNYAKYLSEVKGDLVKAEEYYARSLLADPEDGEVWSMYGGVVWRAHNDAKRAHRCFEEAIKLEPHNCFVLAAYAFFLWHYSEEEDENETKYPLVQSV